MRRPYRAPTRARTRSRARRTRSSFVVRARASAPELPAFWSEAGAASATRRAGFRSSPLLFRRAPWAGSVGPEEFCAWLERSGPAPAGVLCARRTDELSGAAAFFARGASLESASPSGLFLVAEAGAASSGDEADCRTGCVGLADALALRLLRALRRS